MALIFTDFQQEVGLYLLHSWKYVNIRSISKGMNTPSVKRQVANASLR